MSLGQFADQRVVQFPILVAEPLHLPHRIRAALTPRTDERREVVRRDRLRGGVGGLDRHRGPVPFRRLFLPPEHLRDPGPLRVNRHELIRDGLFVQILVHQRLRALVLGQGEVVGGVGEVAGLQQRAREVERQLERVLRGDLQPLERGGDVGSSTGGDERGGQVHRRVGRAHHVVRAIAEQGLVNRRGLAVPARAVHELSLELHGARRLALILGGFRLQDAKGLVHLTALVERVRSLEREIPPEGIVRDVLLDGCRAVRETLKLDERGHPATDRVRIARGDLQHVVGALQSALVQALLDGLGELCEEIFELGVHAGLAAGVLAASPRRHVVFRQAPRRVKQPIARAWLRVEVLQALSDRRKWSAAKVYLLLTFESLVLTAPSPPP